MKVSSVLTAAFALLALLSSAWDCGASGPKALATIGSGSITQDDIERRLEALPESYRQMFQGEEGRAELLSEMVRIEAFSKEARSLGLDKDKAFKARVDDLVKSLLANEYVKRLFSELKMTDKELKGYYERNGDEFMQPERARSISVFVMTPGDASDEALGRGMEEAEGVRARLEKGQDLADLPDNVSVSSPETYARGSIVPGVEEALFGLEPGGVTPVLRMHDGFVFFKLIEKLPQSALPFEEVEDRVRAGLRQEMEKEAFEAAEKRLYSKYKVTLAQAPAPEGRVAAIVTDVIRDGEAVTVLVDAGEGAPFDKAAIKVTGKTVILREADGKRTAAGAADLGKGQSVELKLDGPVLRSAPAQGTAKEIVIKGE